MRCGDGSIGREGGRAIPRDKEEAKRQPRKARKSSLTESLYFLFF